MVVNSYVIKSSKMQFMYAVDLKYFVSLCEAILMFI